MVDNCLCFPRKTPKNPFSTRFMFLLFKMSWDQQRTELTVMTRLGNESLFYFEQNLLCSSNLYRLVDPEVKKSIRIRIKMARKIKRKFQTILLNFANCVLKVHLLNWYWWIIFNFRKYLSSIHILLSYIQIHLCVMFTPIQLTCYLNKNEKQNKFVKVTQLKPYNLSNNHAVSKLYSEK